MGLFTKKCFYCKEKIERGKEVKGVVKVPEFTEKVEKIFCCERHLELYKKNILGTPRVNTCPNCRF